MHIVISYAKQETRLLVQQVCEALEHIEGVTLWWDQATDDSATAEHQHQLEYCDLLIAIISPEVQRMVEGRKGVIKDLLYAQKKMKPIIPVMVGRSEVPSIISRLERLDITQNRAAGIRKLVAQVRELMAGETSTLMLGDTAPHIFVPYHPPPPRFHINWWVLAGIVVFTLGVTLLLIVLRG